MSRSLAVFFAGLALFVIIVTLIARPSPSSLPRDPAAQLRGAEDIPWQHPIDGGPSTSPSTSPSPSPKGTP